MWGTSYTEISTGDEMLNSLCIPYMHTENINCHIIPIYTPEVTLANVYYPQFEAQPVGKTITSWVWVKGLALLNFRLAINMVLAAVFLHLGWIPYLAAILCRVSLPSKLKVVTFT